MTLFALNGNDRIREQCKAREDYRRTWESVKMEMAEKDTVIAELKSSNEKNNSIIDELRSSNMELKSLNEKKDAIIASLKAKIAGFQKP